MWPILVHLKRLRCYVSYKYDGRRPLKEQAAFVMKRGKVTTKVMPTRNYLL
jgi:hypothetical protein